MYLRRLMIYYFIFIRKLKKSTNFHNLYIYMYK